MTRILLHISSLLLVGTLALAESQPRFPTVQKIENRVHGGVSVVVSTSQSIGPATSSGTNLVLTSAPSGQQTPGRNVTAVSRTSSVRPAQSERVPDVAPAGLTEALHMSRPQGLEAQLVAASPLPASEPTQPTQPSTDRVAVSSEDSVKVPSHNRPANVANETHLSSGSVQEPGHYVIGPDDALRINVWHEQEMSGSLPVRPDGKISVPLIGEIQASGLTPSQLEAEITAGLRKYLKNPEVTVIVQEAKSQHFNIIGEVGKPGSYVLTQQSTVLDAIALAGGFRDFAKVKKIYILRVLPDGSQRRLPFNYKQVIEGRNVLQNISLQARDTIVVP